MKKEVKLDYSLKTSEERHACAKALIDATPANKLTPQYLNYISDYVLFVSDKDQTKKERLSEYPILTKNRETTINKRETSYEGLVASLESGEDGVYALINNDKNQLLDPKKQKITQEDIETIPGMKSTFKALEELQKQFEVATGQTKFKLKKAIIETWQQAYILKGSGMTSVATRTSPQIKTISKLNLEEHIEFDERGIPHSDGILTLMNPQHVSFTLNYYSILKQETLDDFQSDMFYFLLDLEEVAAAALEEKEPLLWDILHWKIDGYTNAEIQSKILENYNKKVTEPYISTIWRNKIPKLISQKAQERYVLWYYTTQKKGKWKVCSSCGKTLLAHPFFFSPNSCGDGWYSKCKECRRKK